MKKQIVRRDFIKKAAVGIGAGMMASCTTIAGGTKKSKEPTWAKCGLHSHTLWSDGKSLPEVAISEYKKHGFNMLVMTEHNACADDPQMWLRVCSDSTEWPPRLTRKEFDRTRKDFKFKTKYFSYKTFVKLPTFVELKKQFDEEGKFLLASGEEITTGIDCADGSRRDCHLNVFNVEKTFQEPYPKNVPDCIEKSLKIFNDLKAKSKRPMFMMLNHPFWRFWDVLPEDMLKFPELTHFEICNHGSVVKEGGMLSPDKFWDVILANRIEKKQGVIYATATDDSHNYTPERNNVNVAWTMARVDGEFTVDNTISAIAKGDCYPTTGVLLKDFSFDKSTKTLNVEVKAEAGVEYTIEFITTKRGFDHSKTDKVVKQKNKNLNRVIPIYSDDIGKVVKSVKGTSASCKMAFDDLYIRAKITSSKPTKFKMECYPKKECAGTQPFANS